MFKKLFKTSVFILILASLYGFVGYVVQAQDMGSDQCPATTGYVPPGCPLGTDGKPMYKPDLNCQLNKIANPDNKCCPNICVDSNGNAVTQGETLDASSQNFRKLVIFGTEFRLDPEKIPAVIKVVFQTFLGIVSLYALIRGVYVAGFKRTAVNTPDEIAKLNKELTNMVIGFMICWGFILIVQLVGNFLGLGSLNAVSVNGSSGPVIVIK